jgi:hypothetical protein
VGVWLDLLIMRKLATEPRLCPPRRTVRTAEWSLDEDPVPEIRVDVGVDAQGGVHCPVATTTVQPSPGRGVSSMLGILTTGQ